MSNTSYLFPLAQTSQRSRLVVATSSVLMLLALCALSVPMTLVWLAGHWRAAQ